METLNQLPKTTIKSGRRVGRGYGSQKGGHTTGKGAKGDKVRGKVRITFDGTKIKKGWIKRTPFLRGKHRVLAQVDQYIFNFVDLERLFKADDTVDAKSLAAKTKINAKLLEGNIKILAKGKLTKALNFKGILFSESAKSQILSSGGKID